MVYNSPNCCRSMATKSRSAPVAWTQFFAQEFFFERQVDTTCIFHHVYMNPPTASGPLFVTHHGAGSSALSFAIFTSEIQRTLPDAGVLSVDARGHGKTSVRNADGMQCPEQDLTLDTLAHDLAFIIHSVLPKLSQLPPPPIVLIGHSLGGAVITHLAFNQSSLFSKPVQLLGHVVLDVVEGSAIDALKSMDTYLSTRPKAFTSVPSAVEWHTRSRTLRNMTSARVSVPSLLQKNTDAEGAVVYSWITDLAGTKPFWENWFASLSSKFLEAKGGKLLILAGTDRLDRELMIGQMQGKYQLSVFPEAGHFVHEDQPEKAASIVAEFYRRNDRSTLVLPPKVDELIKMGKLNKPKP